MASIGTFRQQLKAAIGTSLTSGSYTLTAATDVVTGYDDLGAASTLISGMSATAVKMWIRPGVLTGINQDTRLREWLVRCDIWFGMARETDSDLSAIEGLLEAIFARWDERANFSGVGTPKDIRCQMEDYDTKQSPVILHYVVEVTKTIC